MDQLCRKAFSEKYVYPEFIILHHCRIFGVPKNDTLLHATGTLLQTASGASDETVAQLAPQCQ